MADLPAYINIEVKIPITSTLKQSPAPNGVCLSLTADIKKANRFCCKVAKLCASYGYSIEIDRKQLAPPKCGFGVQNDILPRKRKNKRLVG